MNLFQNKRKVLFINQPSAGHSHTLISIACQMRADGHDVRFLIPGNRRPAESKRSRNSKMQMINVVSSVPAILDSHQLEYDFMPIPLQSALLGMCIPFFNGYNEIRVAMDAMNSGILTYTRFIIRYLKDHQFDSIVSDFAFPAAHLAGEVTDTPCSVIYHSGLPFKGSLIPPFGSGLPIGDYRSKLRNRREKQEKRFLRRLDKRMNRARAALGLELFKPEYLRRPYSFWQNIIVSSPFIEAPRTNLTENTSFIGPCFHNRTDDHTSFAFDKLDPEKFRIFVSMGSVFNQHPERFLKILRKLDHPDYQVIVSAGRSFSRLQKEKFSDRILLYPWVPQVSLLPKIDLVIGHGGNNSTNESLSAGKPLIIIPVGGEQGDNARRVEYLGAGIGLDLKTFSGQDVFNTVEQIRGNDTYSSAAKYYGNLLSHRNGPKSASILISSIFANSISVKNRSERVLEKKLS